MDVFKISVPNGIEVGTFDNTSLCVFEAIWSTKTILIEVCPTAKQIWRKKYIRNIRIDRLK